MGICEHCVSTCEQRCVSGRDDETRTVRQSSDIDKAQWRRPDAIGLAVQPSVQPSCPIELSSRAVQSSCRAERSNRAGQSSRPIERSSRAVQL